MTEVKFFRTWDDIRGTLGALEAKGEGPALKVRRDLASQIVRQAEEQGKSVPAFVTAATKTSPRLRMFEQREAAERELRRLEGVLAAEKTVLAEARKRRALAIVDRAVRRGLVHKSRVGEVLRDFESDPDRLLLEFEPELAPDPTDEEFSREFQAAFGELPFGMSAPAREPDAEAKEDAAMLGLRPEDFV